MSPKTAARRLTLRAFRLAIALIALASSAHAQTLASATTASTSGGVYSSAHPKAAADNPFRFWNFSLNETAQYDSGTGWSDVLTPSLLLRPSPHVSFVASLPWYPTVAAYTSSTANGTTTTTLSQHRNVLGDASASAFAGAALDDFNFIAGASVGFPTGDQSLGLSAGSTTWHCGTHAEYSIGHFTPDIEAGVGNSSAFASRFVRKSYTAVGDMANFQAGTNIDLPRKLSLDLEGYEAMPIQPQILYGTIGHRNSHATGHSRRKQTALQGASGSGEDNGLNSSIECSISRKLSVGAEYDRSLIQADNIIAFSVNWVLRTPKRADSSAPASPVAHPGN